MDSCNCQTRNTRSLYPLFMSLYLHIMFAVILDSAVPLIAELLWRKWDTTQELLGEELRLVPSFVTEIGDILPNKPNLCKWMKLDEEGNLNKCVSIVASLCSVIGHLYGHFFTACYCWPSLCLPIMRLQIAPSSNMIG